MSDGVEPPSDDCLRISAEHDRGDVTISLVGEFDMAGTARFWAFVTQAIAANPRAVIVDAHELVFIDSSGIVTLVRAREAVTEAGAAFKVRNPSPAVRRLVQLFGMEDLLADR
jgi:anti-anti-sigma factor